MSSRQRSRNKGTLGGGPSSGRNQNDRGEQGTADVDLRRDRGVGSTLAFDSRRQTKLLKQQVVDYLLEENRVLREQIGGRRMRVFKHPCRSRYRICQTATAITQFERLRFTLHLFGTFRYDGCDRFTKR